MRIPGDLPMIYGVQKNAKNSLFYGIFSKERVLFDSLRSHHSKSPKTRKYRENTGKFDKFDLKHFDLIFTHLNCSDLPMIYGSNSKFFKTIQITKADSSLRGQRGWQELGTLNQSFTRILNCPTRRSWLATSMRAYFAS